MVIWISIKCKPVSTYKYYLFSVMIKYKRSHVCLAAVLKLIYNLSRKYQPIPQPLPSCQPFYDVWRHGLRISLQKHRLCIHTFRWKLIFYSSSFFHIKSADDSPRDVQGHNPINSSLTLYHGGCAIFFLYPYYCLANNVQTIIE